MEMDFRVDGDYPKVMQIHQKTNTQRNTVDLLFFYTYGAQPPYI